MGFLKKRDTKQLVQPFRVRTQASRDEILAFLNSIVAAKKHKVGLLKVDDDGFFVGEAETDEDYRLLCGKRTPGETMVKFYWIAEFRIEESSDGTTRLINMVIVKWREMGTDELVGKPGLLSFRSGFLKYLTGIDPTTAVLGAPA